MTGMDIKPIRLRCEHRARPVIDEPAPKLSWALEGSGRGLRQSAYRVLVARDEESLASEAGLLWDSGWVESDRMEVDYLGETLVSGGRCVWNVRVRDSGGEESKSSETARFEMGLLSRSEWEGFWISAPPSDASGMSPPSGETYDDVGDALAPCPFFRREFAVEKSVRSARIYATARGLYELRLNGGRVGEDVLTPGWTDYTKRLQYQTCDVTDLLAEGENVLGGVLGDGWYAGFVGFDPKRRGAHYGPKPQLLVQMVVEYEDGTVGRLGTDGTWKCSTGPILHSDLLMGESCDARLELDGWDRTGYDDSGWNAAEEEESGEVPLLAQTDEGIRVTEEVSPVSVTEPESGVYVFDLGQNIVGRTRLRVRGEAGTTVTLKHAEALDPSGGIYTENLRFAHQTDRYVLSGGGEETCEPRFTFHGFRYVEARGLSEAPSVEDLAGVVLHSDTPRSGSFECSSDLVNRLQSNIVWGQRGNFLSIPTDCPQRDERLGWMGDAQIFVRTAAFNMDVAAFFEKWMADVVDAQSPQGAFPDVAPLPGTSGLIDLTHGAPAWGDAGVIVPWTLYRVYNDKRIIERNYEAMSRWMDYLLDANPDFLRKNALGNNYGDWLSPKGDFTPKDLLATAYWAYDARLMAEMARAIGRDDDAREYAALRERVVSAFRDEYVEADGRLAGDTQTAYVLALHMDLLPEESRPAAADRLVAAIEREGWRLSTGFVGVGYLLPVLSETGHTDVAYRLLNNTGYPSWGYTVEQGATTIWERWDGWTEEKGFQSPNMNSFNHYSLGSVGEWLYRYVAGIDLAPGSAGYERVCIQPHPGGGLTGAKAEYDSVRGRVFSEWRTGSGTLRLVVVVPPNVEAEVRVPTSNPETVTESGVPVSGAEGLEVLGYEGSHLSVFVGSGDYEFCSEIQL